MAIRVVKFSNGGYKIKKVFDKELTYSKLLNFENWVNGGVRSFKNQSFKSQSFSSTLESGINVHP